MMLAVVTQEFPRASATGHRPRECDPCAQIHGWTAVSGRSTAQRLFRGRARTRTTTNCGVHNVHGLTRSSSSMSQAASLLAAAASDREQHLCALARTPSATNNKIEVAFLSSRKPTRARPIEDQPARSAPWRASAPSTRPTRHSSCARRGLARPLPTSPANTTFDAQRTRRIFVYTRSAPAIKASSGPGAAFVRRAANHSAIHASCSPRRSTARARRRPSVFPERARRRPLPMPVTHADDPFGVTFVLSRSSPAVTRDTTTPRRLPLQHRLDESRAPVTAPRPRIAVRNQIIGRRKTFSRPAAASFVIIFRRWRQHPSAPQHKNDSG